MTLPGKRSRWCFSSRTCRLRQGSTRGVKFTQRICPCLSQMKTDSVFQARLRVVSPFSLVRLHKVQSTVCIEPAMAHTAVALLGLETL